ncbi:SDR family NAD(P)-dependent oxidoreductase [Blastococcus sp. Marseille-P5729]|uniref:SDR family NAD(P)-dependent oxidoreductase n=1 Tax=Blastococcus sp. Marseille-P5729 TaxID=2086582 RepID=UPI000D0F8BCD|nr:SDR family oxidoreductase [Blastococcus sp. Marseille-P5729]
MQTHHDEVALITGAGSGIGRATAVRFASDGYRVVIADLNESNARETAATINELSPGRATTVRADVRLEEDVERMVRSSIDTYGGLDVLVNNAGLGGAFGSVTETSVEDWDFTFEVLVRGVFLGVKHAARAMRDGGRIVNIASIAAYSGSSGPLAYTAAKHAVVGLTRAAAVELGPRGIRVNAVSPGVIRTPLMETGADTAHLDSVLPLSQLTPRWGQSEDIAGAIAFLAGKDSRFMNGESILVDGGVVAAGPGPAMFEHLGTDPKSKGLVGVNRGTTGERSMVRKRISSN